MFDADEKVPEGVGLVVAHDLDVVDAEHFGGFRHRVVPVADLVDEVERKRLVGGEDASVGNVVQRGGVDAATGADDAPKPVVHRVDHFLQQRDFLRVGFAERIEHVLVVARFDCGVGDADFVAEHLPVQALHDDTDGSDDGGRLRDQPVARHRHIVSARRGEVAHQHHDLASLGAFLEAHQLDIHLVARGDATARGVDFEDDRHDLLVVARGADHVDQFFNAVDGRFE